MNTKENQTNKRDTEQTTDKHYISRIAWKIKTLFLNNPKSIAKLQKIYKSLTYKNLQSWSDPYQDYYFSGKNKFIPQEWFEKWNLGMFKDINLLEDILSRDETINFEWNEDIKNQVNLLVQSFIKNKLITGKNSIIDDKSRKNLENAFVEAEQKHCKIIFIANHASHFDAPILNYTLNQAIQELHKQNQDIPIKKVRFICGAYMYYNKGVRNFTAAFDTTLVFGPKDLQELKWYLEEKHRRDLIIKFHKEALKKTSENSDAETTLLFPYAGRAENNNWCKDELPKGISSYLEKTENIYVPIWCVWSSSILSTGDLYQVSKNIDIFDHVKNIIKHLKFSELIKLVDSNADQKELVKLIKKADLIAVVMWILDNMDIFKLLQFLDKYKFKFFKPEYIHMNIWEYFVWWEKNLEEINDIMHTISNEALDMAKLDQKQ